MNLTEHFTLEEFTTSQVAERNGLDNTPGPRELENLQHTAEGMEQVRDLLGYSIHINSGYRAPAVNKAAGSTAKHSQHMDGCAVDFICPKFGTPREIVDAVIESDIEFDQIILEYDRWVHISFVENGSRRQALVIDKAGTRLYK